jgi:hypothetical protein
MDIYLKEKTYRAAFDILHDNCKYIKNLERESIYE